MPSPIDLILNPFWSGVEMAQDFWTLTGVFGTTAEQKANTAIKYVAQYGVPSEYEKPLMKGYATGITLQKAESPQKAKEWGSTTTIINTPPIDVPSWLSDIPKYALLIGGGILALWLLKGDRN